MMSTWKRRKGQNYNTAQQTGCKGTSLAVQSLGFCISTVWGTGSVPGQGTKIPKVIWHCQKKNPKQYVNCKV